MVESKPLGSDDQSSARFVMECLRGDYTYAVNFDRIQYNHEKNCWVIVEFQKCHERQFPRGITPFTSHPNKYFHRAWRKYLKLWELKTLLNADLYVINYAERDTAYADEVLVLEITNIDRNARPPISSVAQPFASRDKFSDWFRELNRKGRGDL